MSARRVVSESKRDLKFAFQIFSGIGFGVRVKSDQQRASGLCAVERQAVGGVAKQGDAAIGNFL